MAIDTPGTCMKIECHFDENIVTELQTIATSMGMTGELNVMTSN